MKCTYQILSVFTLITSSLLLSACGSSSVKHDSSGSVAEQKTERAATTIERRVDQHTDNKISKAIDKLFR